MKEQDSSERDHDDYWTDDLQLGDGVLYNQPHTLRLALHQATERYFGRKERFPLASPNGTRLYFHARPYILISDIRLTVALHPEPRGSDVGTVAASHWEGMRHKIVGNAQGWYYPAEKSLMLWECFLEDRHRIANPLEDANQAVLWNGFEEVLLTRSPGVEHLYTTWEDSYNRPMWQKFLEAQGYRKVDKALFEKIVCVL